MIVIGAGLAGLATAHELQRRGRRVLILDAAPEPAAGASHANGGLLTPSMSDPWNAPGVHRLLCRSLVDRRSAFALRLRALPSLGTWGVRFLRNATATRYRAATQASFRLAAFSLKLTRELRVEYGLQYDGAVSGSLKLFRDPVALNGPLGLARTLAVDGLRFDVLDGAQAARIEPALAPIAGQLAAALHFPDDEVGDARLFCQHLAARIRDGAGELRTDAPVTAIVVERGRAVAVRCQHEELRADAVVLAAGAWSDRLARTGGLRLPIRPAKGYSLTLPVSDVVGRPTVPVIDDAMHAAVTPIGRRLRVAGTAEFAGFDLALRRDRVDNLWRLLRGIYPELARGLRTEHGQAWTGLRPMSSDGLPLIGESRVRGLWVNAGHGHLGWTMAMGAARLIAEQFEQVPRSIPDEPYRVHR